MFTLALIITKNHSKQNHSANKSFVTYVKKNLAMMMAENQNIKAPKEIDAV